MSLPCGCGAAAFAPLPHNMLKLPQIPLKSRGETLETSKQTRAAHERPPDPPAAGAGSGTGREPLVAPSWEQG